MIDGQASDTMISSAQADYDALRYVSPEKPCPYLPDKNARSEAYGVEQLDTAVYERLLTRGFRRSGRVVYRPRCRACRECRQMRVPVDSFQPTRSMRRVARRNADVIVEEGRPAPTQAKFALYCRYLDAQHDDSMARSYETFCEFLYDSPMQTTEFRYRLGEHLLGVSIADRLPSGLSSVYMYFDPDFADRSLGTFSVLWEIDYCRRAGLPYYYLGFYIAGSPTMSYKSRFRPNEILVADDRWVTLQV
jgi:arginyl-tRNA--protein-N-Asp/Glu arginylyltransferase